VREPNITRATFAKTGFRKLKASLLSGGWFCFSKKCERERERERERTPPPINAFHSSAAPVSLSFSLPS